MADNFTFKFIEFNPRRAARGARAARVEVNGDLVWMSLADLKKNVAIFGPLAAFTQAIRPTKTKGGDMASNKTIEAISRMKTWLRENGGRCTPEFVADLTTLIEAAKGEQRQELVRRFAVALVGSEWYYKFRDGKFNAEHVWRTASELADAEPPSNT